MSRLALVQMCLRIARCDTAARLPYDCDYKDYADALCDALLDALHAQLHGLEAVIEAVPEPTCCPRGFLDWCARIESPNPPVEVS
jgi:hypothetical protein